MGRHDEVDGQIRDIASIFDELTRAIDRAIAADAFGDSSPGALLRAKAAAERGATIVRLNWPTTGLTLHNEDHSDRSSSVRISRKTSPSSQAN